MDFKVITEDELLKNTVNKIFKEVADNKEKMLEDFFKAYLAKHPEIKSIDEIEFVQKTTPDSIILYFRKKKEAKMNELAKKVEILNSYAGNTLGITYYAVGWEVRSYGDDSLFQASKEKQIEADNFEDVVNKAYKIMLKKQGGKR